MDCAAPELGSGIRRTDYDVQGPFARLIEKHIKTDEKKPSAVDMPMVWVIY